LLGNLTREPTLKYLPNQTAVTEFGMALNRKYKTANGEQREEVAFVDIVFFGKLGETINQYCTKGQLLYVEGRLKFDTWEDKRSGDKRSKLSIVGEQFQFVGGKQDENPPGSRKPATQEQSPIDPNERSFNDQDIPFDPDPQRC
jgi:single-strand DNA-binding protein